MLEASLSTPLEVADPEAANLIQKDLNRDASSLNLMAAESYPTLAVRDACAAPIIGLEGYPGKRYHSGSFVMDEVELLGKRRALEAFDLSTNEWSVNMQPLSGSLANLYTYVGLVSPGEVILRMELSHGGHISHGHRSSSRNISEASYRYNSIPYHTDPDTGIIDYDEVEALALKHRPRIITTGYSAYCRLIDFAPPRSIAEKVNAYLHCDMAHICGLIASHLIPSPFPHCGVVTTTTYKTIRGPPAAMIFSRTAPSNRINRTLYPRFQAGIGFANVLAMAVALRQLQTLESRQQQQQFLDLAQVMAQRLLDIRYRLVSGGTDIHMLLIDLRDKGVGGFEVEKILEMANIVCNRNSIPGDNKGACSGIRLCATQMTIRGMNPSQGCKIAELVHHGIQRAQRVNQLFTMQSVQEVSNNAEAFEKFSRYLRETQEHQEILELRAAVSEWVEQYPPPALTE